MQIKIQLSNENGQSNFEGNELTQAQADTLIQGFIGSLGLAVPTPVQYTTLQTATCGCGDDTCEAPQDETQALSSYDLYKQAITQGPVELSKEDELALINAHPPLEIEGGLKIVAQPIYTESPSFGTNLGDKLSQAFLSKPVELTKPVAQATAEVKGADVKPMYAEQQDYFVTGIKYKTIKGVDNVPTYKCRYECQNPTCRTKGTHYIAEGTEVVYCYNCSSKLYVDDATSLGFPNRDDWGNFYFANEEVEEDAWKR